MVVSSSPGPATASAKEIKQAAPAESPSLKKQNSSALVNAGGSVLAKGTGPAKPPKATTSNMDDKARKRQEAAMKYM